jgi:hypothetical protein
MEHKTAQLINKIKDRVEKVTDEEINCQNELDIIRQKIRVEQKVSFSIFVKLCKQIIN